MIRDFLENIEMADRDIDSGFWQYEYAKKAKESNNVEDAKYHISEATDYHKDASSDITHAETMLSEYEEHDIHEIAEFMIDHKKHRLAELENKIKKFII